MMLNQIATEALYSATYVDNYIDSVENLPDDVQRHLSRIRDIDVQYRNLLNEVDHYYELWHSLQLSSEGPANRRSRALNRMHQSLILAQELGDEKMQIVNQLQELIDQKTRQLDHDQQNLDIKEDFVQQSRVEPMLVGDEYVGATPAKQMRSLSPERNEQVLNAANGSIAGLGLGERHGSLSLGSGKEHNLNAFPSYAVSVGSSGGGGGGSTPNSERSGGHVSNGAAGNSTGNGTVGGVVAPSNSNLTGNDAQHRGGTSSKRSRRRNENVVNSNSVSMEFGGNESNSANETGSNGGSNERKASNASAGHKKNAAHQAGGTTGISVNTGASGSGAGAGSGNNSGKKKKRKARGAQAATAQTNARDETPPPEPIDPDEPTYCVCNQISFGEMILCDNDLCPIEWFHFSCVALVLKPKGKWYCPNCRGDRPNVMKPKAQFLKELERYNKEKEEKT